VRTAGDEEEDVCEWATAALEELGPPAVEDLNALSDLLRADSADTAYWAATLIGRLGAQAAPVVAALVTTLTESAAATVRQRVAWALGEIGRPALAAKPALEQAKNCGDPRLAKLAAQALASIIR
jgi:HEAT repeat protein